MEPSKTMACPQCGNVVAVTDQFCSRCFARIERPSLRQRLTTLFRTKFRFSLRARVNRREVSLQVGSQPGERHVYRSLDEVPLEFRPAFEKLQAEALRGLNPAPPSAEAPGTSPKVVAMVRSDIQVFKIKDASGKEQVYHSLAELPPEKRALFEQALRRLDSPTEKPGG